MEKDMDIDDLLNFINDNHNKAANVSNVKKPKNKGNQQNITTVLNPSKNDIVESFEAKVNIDKNADTGEQVKETKEGENNEEKKKKKHRRKKKNKDDKDSDDDNDEEAKQKAKQEATIKNKELYKSFFNIDASTLTKSRFQDNSRFRILGSWKEADEETKDNKDNKDGNKISYRQTNIPSLQIEEQYKNKDYPVNQIMTYRDQEWRTNSEEKRAVERLLLFDLQNLRKAAEAQRQVRKYAQTIIKPGERLIDICDRIENMNRYIINAQGYECGIGFPTGCSINHCAAHWTPNPGDTTILKENDVCKIDFGTQVNGLIIDTAFTVAFNPEYDELLLAVQDATNTGLREAGIDVRLGDLGGYIQEVMESYEVVIKGKTHQVKSVKNLCGHSIEPYKIHAGKSIPIVKKVDNTKMEEGELFAIETFGSTGK